MGCFLPLKIGKVMWLEGSERFPKFEVDHFVPADARGQKSLHILGKFTNFVLN